MKGYWESRREQEEKEAREKELNLVRLDFNEEAEEYLNMIKDKLTKKYNINEKDVTK